MFWSFRNLVVSVAFVCAAAPQMACFIPHETPTETAMDCCEQMEHDCDAPKMSECCQTIVRSDVSTSPAKSLDDLTPQLEIAEWTVERATPLSSRDAHEIVVHNSHAPPHGPDESPLVLRI